MMEAEFNHLNHATWECKYHVVFTPECRKKLLFGKIKRHLGQVFNDLARRKECRIEEGHLMPDHVHMLISGDPADLPPLKWFFLKYGFDHGG
jgi:putative transposase